ncbi:UDP-2,4-diacetamido-2,4,6-trideoxy-beta-L-altropyranose hydrolase [Phenylobacterium sp.]|jgi:UDP-2,4-diacetamido-2,4,6-trideoxy-beta-L-altropyranose hydrolase|uniref:UDP-2,4-diacetamido-2,4, 6-trideoxy-beta-L-altropyranose hydrolase n=1 Tax=Phenylobacterium sp. TaxID=1871053 RepID=UPI000C8E7D95|nr:UDP-2,4-diacetamido-2,4,6-trideoxy-beta-L-altropyranose hydrolase [Phenylobacterium sp.]MAK83706.1 UDP-2,4-diacetamido-2,4,6-trideoxy-beta-L-altropyranose hydrolase [Phenylobacterium sp.]|tara:strand:- start:3840 stop:4871 length:1032 start_codon:yes stop_codon:yes gene_type:complete
MTPRVLFIANAGPEVGGGHVMRSLTLAAALTERGARVEFMADSHVEAILAAYAPDLPRRAAASMAPDVLADLAGRQAFEAVVFDHYGLGRPDHEAIADGRPALVIDDLADRSLGGALILDSGPARTEADYRGLTSGARLLLGPKFAPVRPAFAALRNTALARRKGTPRRVLVSMGLTDLDGITGKVVEQLRRRYGETELDVVVGAGAPSRKGLTRIAAHDPRLTLHVDTPDMAELATAADLAVGAAGSAMWERCVLGLPSVVVTIADNQVPAATALAKAGAVLRVDGRAESFGVDFDRAMTRLFIDETLRASLAEKSAELCDGEGAARVADAFWPLLVQAATV